jgi:hypothetical protein
MKLKFTTILFLTVSFLLGCQSIHSNSEKNSSVVANPNKTILPDQFPVYVLGTTVSRLPPPGPFPGFTQKILPTDNTYKGNPGCYIICYSHDENGSIYPISEHIFVMGQIRILGQYQQRICVPKGYEHSNISTLKNFNKLCALKIASCQKNNCWTGGDTGGWFNIR